MVPDSNAVKNFSRAKRGEFTYPLPPVDVSTTRTLATVLESSLSADYQIP